MKQLLILALSISLIYTQQCDMTQQLYYQGGCVDKTCLNDKLQKFRLTPKIGMDKIGNVGELSTAIVYGALPQQDANGNFYKVVIRWNDDSNNQILGDPDNCIQHRIYATENSYEINPTRKYVTSNGEVPTWPQSFYTFDTTTSLAQIHFDIRHSDLDTQCLRLPGAQSIEYTCFYEMAFLVRRITQVSYHFSIRVLVNTGTSSQGPNMVDFVKLVEVDNCPTGGDSGTGCLVNVKIGSTLKFCQDSTCAQVSDNPFTTLFLNREFYMAHEIVDVSFKSWFINNIRMHFQAIGLTLQYAGTEINIFKKERGRNIYKLRVPIVQPEVIITATGVISQSQTRMLQDTTGGVIPGGSQGQVIDSKSTGEIKVEPTTNTDTTNNQNNVQPQTQDDDDKSDTSSSSYIIPVMAAIVPIILLQ